MATPAIANYRDASHHLLAQARAELATGDLRQASEKGWGAAAQMIKAVAEGRDLPHRSHHLLVRVIGSVLAETGDMELGDLFVSAQSLHINFYENWLIPELVERCIGRVHQLIAKLEPLIEA